MSTTHAKKVADWLAAHPAPIHRSELSAWGDRVRSELSDAALEDLVDLLAHGDLEQQYQALAAARVLGAEVWAEGHEPEVRWLVRLPGETSEREVRPEHQLAS
jgi:hypothetical protein